jgi:hypothetical protein
MRQLYLPILGASLVLVGLSGVPAAEGVADDERTLKGAGLPTDGPGLLAYIRQRTVNAASEERLKTLIRQLGDDEFKVREHASRQLVAIGPRARPALRAALESPDPEVKRRAEECLQQISEGATAAVIASAVRLLAERKPDGAAETLLDYLPGAEDETVAETVRAALASLAVRDGKAEPAVVKALEDRVPVKRAAAGAALARARLPEQLPAVRKLLADPDAQVRMRVALALASVRDKAAVAVLIGLLDQLPLEETGLIDSFLDRLAGEAVPEAVLTGTEAAARRKYRDAWAAWWKEHEARIDPARLEQATRSLGYTMVVLLDQGKVMDLDTTNRPRWSFGELDFPLDAQILPSEERVLVAEYKGNRVTERDLKGAVKWEKKIEEPLAVQRLSNGNTFIATRTKLVEVDKDGKEVFSYSRPDGAFFMKVQRLRSGDIACVVNLGVARYVRLSRSGNEVKEVKTFGVDLHTSGGKLDVLANGHVIIPETHNNRVVEYDPDGKVVWSADVVQPIAALRLPNGNTLVTSGVDMTGVTHRAVEIDRAGKEVWQFRGDTRVTRAFRR